MISNLTLLTPECALLTLTLVTMLLDLFFGDKLKSLAYLGTQLTLVVTFALLVSNGMLVSEGLVEQHLKIDATSQWLKVTMVAVMFFVCLYSRAYIRDRVKARLEFYLLALFSLLGMCLMVSANSLLMVYLGIELVSLPLYAMVAIYHDKADGTEAAIKYFVMGALASGLLLFGMSLTYGVTGHIDLPSIASYLGNQHSASMAVGIALLFMIAGLGFKLGVVPFHMWVPDVYQGAPSAVTLMIATAPKIAALGVLYRILGQAFISMHADWQVVWMAFAVLSIGIGNLLALVQTNLKRLLAYSTIGHMGFVVAATLNAPQDGFSSAIFYLSIYVLGSLMAFGTIIFLSYKGFEAEHVVDLKGLSKRHPWLAFLMLVACFSFAGVPPTAGFYAKFVVLQQMVTGGHLWFAVYAVVMSVIGAFYYLNLIKVMYFDAPEVELVPAGPRDLRVALTLNGLVLILLGLMPGPLLAIANLILHSPLTP